MTRERSVSKAEAEPSEARPSQRQQQRDAFFLEEYGAAPPETVADLKRMQQVYVRACFRFPGYVRIPLVEGTEDNERVWSDQLFDLIFEA